MLLSHGDDDRNVPFRQTTDLIEKMRTQNVAFTQPAPLERLARAYWATAEFFDRKLAASGERE